MPHLLNEVGRQLQSLIRRCLVSHLLALGCILLDRLALHQTQAASRELGDGTWRGILRPLMRRQGAGGRTVMRQAFAKLANCVRPISSPEPPPWVT